MSIFEFLRIIYRNLAYLLLIPLVIGITVFLLTGNSPEKFESKALLYTGLASGYDIESGSSENIDYRAVNASYDNLMSIIKSRHTLEEVGLRLLSLHLIQNEPNDLIAPEAFDKLSRLFPKPKRIEMGVVKGDVSKTYENLNLLFVTGHPFINKLIYGDGSYSIDKLQNINIIRVKSSDMIQVSYTSYHPGMAKSTLDILLQVFSRNYTQLKKSETGDVVAYFEEELRKAKENLDRAEDELTEFRVQSRVINYGEETKALAIKKQNAVELFAEKKMNLKATEAALKEIEEKLSARQLILSKNIELIEKKKELENLTTKLTRLEVAKSDSSVIAIARNELDNVKNDINKYVRAHVNLVNSKEGLTSGQLVARWLENLIQLNRERVNVSLFEQRLEEIDKAYDRFTPMGSNIDRLERQISVYEREYLEVLHGLNMSKLRQQNIEMKSNLELIDKPNYPIDPLPSKRLLFVVIAALFGGFSTLAFIIARELLNHSLRNPEKAHRITGLEIAGAYPVFDQNYQTNYHKKITPKITSLLVNKLDMAIESHPKPEKSKIVTFFSVVGTSGVSTISRLVYWRLNLSELNVALVTYEKNPKVSNPEHVYTYDITNAHKPAESIFELAGIQNPAQYDRILFVLPPLVDGFQPSNIIKESSVAVAVTRADKVWTNAHRYLLDNFRQLTGRKPLMVLNAIKLYDLDQIIVDVPIKRNKIVEWVRGLAQFEFSKAQLHEIQTQ